MTAACRDLLDSYVALHNHGVVSGDFGPMLTLFTSDAEMRFTGLAVGPFAGRDRIAWAFEHDPPNASLEVVRVTSEHERSISADYGWSSRPGRVAGRLTIELRDGRIALLALAVEHSGRDKS
jgi:hypothetical protein